MNHREGSVFLEHTPFFPKNINGDNEIIRKIKSGDIKLSTQKKTPRKLKEGIKGDAKFGMRLTLPAQIFVNVVVIFPILATLYLSFTD